MFGGEMALNITQKWIYQNDEDETENEKKWLEIDFHPFGLHVKFSAKYPAVWSWSINVYNCELIKT